MLVGWLCVNDDSSVTTDDSSVTRFWSSKAFQMHRSLDISTEIVSYDVFMTPLCMWGARIHSVSIIFVSDPPSVDSGCAKSQIWVTDGFVGYSEPSPKSHPDCSLGSYARGALTYTSYTTSQTTMTTRYNFTSMIFDISRNRRIRRLYPTSRRLQPTTRRLQATNSSVVKSNI